MSNIDLYATVAKQSGKIKRLEKAVKQHDSEIERTLDLVAELINTIGQQQINHELIVAKLL